MDRIENHRCRITAFLCDDDDIVALAPHHQLFAGRSAKRVARRQHDALAFRLEKFGELADGGGFARTIDARHHDHKRFRDARVNGLFQWLHQGRERAFKFDL